MTGQINQLREALQAIPSRGSQGSERESLVSELEAIPSQLEALAKMIQPIDGQAPSTDDAALGWEQYRVLSLKLSRLATRVEELAAPTPQPAGKAAGGKSGAAKKK